MNRKWILSGKTEDLAVAREQVRGFLLAVGMEDELSATIVLAMTGRTGGASV